MARITRLLLSMATSFFLASHAWASDEPTTGVEPAPSASAAQAPASEETPAPDTAPTQASDAAAAGDTLAAEGTGAQELPDTARPHVALARFTTAIENREPVDAVTFLENDASRVFFYTDLRNFSGETVTHRWELGEKVMAEVPFEVGSDRWRVWSSKRLKSDWTGDWTVVVVKQNGEVVASESFTLQPKAEQ